MRLARTAPATETTTTKPDATEPGSTETPTTPEEREQYRLQVMQNTVEDIQLRICDDPVRSYAARAIRNRASLTLEQAERGLDALIQAVEDAREAIRHAHAATRAKSAPESRVSFV